MNSAAYVDKLIAQLKAEQVPLSEAVFRTGVACVGWPYTFGAEGRTATKNGVTVRTFDCQGFTEWCLLQFGINIKAAGCTSQWDNESLWEAKGAIADGMPENVLVCLFYRKEENPKKMAHTGFGFEGQTVECSSGVQFSKTRSAKWQYWAVPKGIGGEIPVPEPKKPTLRKGDSGPYVTLAQTQLIQRGYDLGSYGADGKFGNATEKAVKQFQQDWGLSVDGIIGPKTWEMLDSTPTAVKYYVIVPHLSLHDAEALAALYTGATIVKEDD